MTEIPPSLVKFSPVQAPDRIASLDVLRGFAVLGILIMSIQSFSMIRAAFINPSAFGDLAGVNKWVWIIGLVHAYLFWYGDILVGYALCGMLFFLFRKARTGRLLFLGFCSMLMGMALYKWDFLSARKSAKTYLTSMVPGLVLGFPPIIYRIIQNFRHEWSHDYSMWFGPAEWLRRSLTYRQLQPIRKEVEGLAVG